MKSVAAARTPLLSAVLSATGGAAHPFSRRTKGTLHSDMRQNGDWPSSALRTSLGRKGGIMRNVGHRQERPISFSASAVLLAEGARFNDEIHRLPTGNATYIPKGIFRFKTHEDANRHQVDCLVEGMAQAALARR
ncbi:MAG: hypothetical protein IPJ27_23425 [Candidatus Accumulibacter sp.]|uniref:Uncharacterized protein n=1 Tax=Candidatus Accumulibacter proximus TaxID=2954385 RepID=A0A935Q3Y6_9PROT|nr:hypothetical protein [Candidatus Accumulibacter proximus]